MKKIIPIFLASLLSAFLAVFIYAKFFASTPVIQEHPVPIRYTHFAEESKAEKYIVASPDDFTDAAAKVTSAVVHIKSMSKSYDWWGSADFTSSSGSGVIVSNDGYIVTNNHVIEDATDIEVTMDDKRTYKAQLVGADSSTDLALIKIEADDTPFLDFADSDRAKIGEWVLAVGNPFSLTSTVTAGIISAKARDIEILNHNEYAIESFIQTDAAVNPGNSGGALVNTNGDLVGINTAIMTKSGRYEGYSFAVPSNLVKKVIGDLKEFGKVQRGLLNVKILEVNETKKNELGLPSLEGVYIEEVVMGGSAHDAGLQAGDVILGVGGRKIKTIPELQEIVGIYRPGEELEVEFFRNGKKEKARLTLKNKFNSTALNKKVSKNLDDLGVEIRNLSPKEMQEIKSQGVKVVSIYRNSKIDATNMEPGYIITKLNDQKIASVDDLVEAYANMEPGTKIMLEGFYAEYPDEYFYAFRK